MGFSINNLFSQIDKQFKDSTQEWQLKFSSVGNNPGPTEQEKTNIIGVFDRHLLEHVNSVDLRELSKSIIKDSMYNHIHLSRQGLRGIVATLDYHEPALKVRVDKMRFLSQNGQLFGDAVDSALPELVGIYRNDQSEKKFRQKNANEVYPNQNEANLLNEALDLKKQLERSNLPIKK